MKTNYQAIIKEILNTNNATASTAGIGLDFKTLYITNQSGYSWSVGGANYKQALEQLRKYSYNFER